MSSDSSYPISPFLDAWLSHDWTTGLQTEDLPEHGFLTVETEHSRYELTVLCGSTGDVLVRGGQFFPYTTAARLAGSSVGGSLLKLRGIYIGFRMELHAHDRGIITSRVRSIVLVSGVDARPVRYFPDRPSPK
jgi:hypothetical protein